MDLRDIQFIFNRAWSLTFNRKKLLSVFVILMLCGILVVFFKGLALHTGQWVAMSLTFLPIFLCAGVLLSTGVILIRIYHDEVKKRPHSYRSIVFKSWDLIMGTAYLSIPLILAYLLLWMMLGVFFLLNELPGVGGFFGVILAFAPFLLNLGALFLCVISLSTLFFIAPVVALHGINRIQLSQLLTQRFQQDMFLNLFLATIAACPLLLITGLLTIAAMMTGAICYTCPTPVYVILQWFFVMIPFTAVLTPGVVFFFNFAAEAHVLIRRQR
ncbi:MAG: hypothetical protein H0X51_05130 [Parachlamydiaceae bacterium]|nr:hypothetical protein [Parachlamydiaceae bacterium]